MRNSISLAGILIVLALPLCAQQGSAALQGSPADTAALEQKIKDLEDRIIALEGQVRMLKSGPSMQPAPTQPSATPAEAAAQAPPSVLAQPPASSVATSAGQLPIYGGASAASKALNPDISVIGDFLGAAGYGANRATPALEMHESEAGFQARVCVFINPCPAAIE